MNLYLVCHMSKTLINNNSAAKIEQKHLIPFFFLGLGYWQNQKHLTIP